MVMGAMQAIIAFFSIFTFIAATTALWIYMLIDCLGRKKFEDKLAWVIVILMLHFVGALMYFFMTRKRR
jgi:hypothetical protein